MEKQTPDMSAGWNNDPDLDLIFHVIPNYGLGRERGFSDEETRQKAYEAFCRARSLLTAKEVTLCRISDKEVFPRCPTCYVNMESNYDFCPWCGQQLYWETEAEDD